MKSTEVRRKFLDFFKSKEHTIVPSDSLVPANDPSVLFTSAGMNQFKEYFLGIRREMKRAASCQKCFRTGDVEQVGQTASHLTFFEMLGNFSFGDYFKEEAIAWGWEFMTQGLKLPPEKLWVTVYESDEEAEQIWKTKIKFPKERLRRFGAKDNFWPSNAPTQGPNGPCGPCSELHYDYGRSFPGKVCPNPAQCGPGCSCGRFVEVWNLVFTQFDRQPDGKLLPLPSKNIDTGMGLERLSAIMQDKMSVFETDLFEPIVKAVQAGSSKSDQALLFAVADHARALTMLIGDGVAPSNEGRGYVLRMLLRKAERSGRALGYTQPFLYQLVPAVAKIMQEPYPEITNRRESIAQVILGEEERFLQTLEQKLPLLKEEIRNSVPGTKQVPGTELRFSAEQAARFYDTHGLSYEEIAEVCSEEGLAAPDRQVFEKALEQLQVESKTKSKFEGDIWSKDKLAELLNKQPPTEFTGYAPDLTVPAKVMALVQESRSVAEAAAPAQIELVLDKTPFYGEAGGQVGDAGVIEGPDGRVEVLDTQWVGNVLVHRAKVLKGKVKVGDPVNAGVDPQRRLMVAANHTATHLLHSALRKVLGEHVMQAGSLVAPDHLRLDFSHGKPLSRAEKEAAESLVNEWVEKNLSVRVDVMPVAEAKRLGAMALFGEKYGSQVRVVSVGDVSKELCGGTHLKSSSDIGVLTIAQEGSIASGVRRVEALSSQAAIDSLKSQVERLQQEKERLSKRKQELENEKSRLRSA